MKVYRKARKLYCHDCMVMFTVYFKMRRMPSCPKCEDHIAVKATPYPKEEPENPKKRDWTEEEVKKLIRFRNNTTLTYKQIGKELGRSWTSIRGKIRRLEAEGVL